MSRLRRPLGVGVAVGDGVDYIDVARAFYSSFGPRAIKCCQFIGRGRYVLTCSSSEAFELITAAGAITINNEIISIEAIDSPVKWITVRFAPFEMHQGVINAALAQYGDVLEWEYEMDREFPDLANGNRRILIRMKIPVPNILHTEKHRLIVTYGGMIKTCFKCKGEGHIAAECMGTTNVEQKEANKERNTEETEEENRNNATPMAENKETENIDDDDESGESFGVPTATDGEGEKEEASLGEQSPSTGISGSTEETTTTESESCSPPNTTHARQPFEKSGLGNPIIQSLIIRSAVTKLPK